jgi:hypothetical protein
MNHLSVSILTTVLLISSTALLGAQETKSISDQASAGGWANRMATVPAGTRLMVKMVDAVDSDRSNPNERFRGTLESNLMAGNIMVAPKGTTVFGRVLTAVSAGSSGGQLEFDLTDIRLDGQLYSLATNTNQVQGQGSSSQAAGGAKTGAAVGAIVGGISGAMRGAGAGAAAGHVSGVTTTGERVNVPSGALVEFTLDHPVSLPVAR